MNAIPPAWLAATGFLDCRRPAIQAFVAKNAGGTRKNRHCGPTLLGLRDGVRHDPYGARMRHEAMRASMTATKGAGQCANKALACAACLRAIGIPGAQRFRDGGVRHGRFEK